MCIFVSVHSNKEFSYEIRNRLSFFLHCCFIFRGFIRQLTQLLSSLLILSDDIVVMLSMLLHFQFSKHMNRPLRNKQFQSKVK